MKLLHLKPWKVHSVVTLVRNVTAEHNYRICQRFYSESKYVVSAKCMRKYSSIPWKYQTTQSSFIYEVDENALAIELEKCAIVNNNSMSKRLNEINELDKFESKDNAMQVINYIIYTEKINQNAKQIQSSTDKQYFNKFLPLLEQFVPCMQADELVSSLIALSIADVPLHHPTNRALTIQISKALKGEITIILFHFVIQL